MVKTKTNLFDFVIFKNYDGTKTGKAIPREVYKKLFNQNVQLSATNGIIYTWKERIPSETKIQGESS